MKWLNKILGKEEVIPATVAFNEIDAWLELVSKSLFRGLGTNADQLYKEISDTRDRLKQDTTELQDAEPKADMPDTIAKIGLPNRDKLVKNLYSLTEKISIPTRTDYKTVLAFYGATHSNIKSALGKSSKTIYYVRSLFPDEVKEVESDLKRLRTALNLLVTPIKGKESKITNLERVPTIVQDIKDLKSGIAKEKENVREQEEESSTLEMRIGTEEKRLRVIEDSEDWRRFKEFETELATLKEELTAVELEISNLFAPINKELKLLKKQDETGRFTLTPEERKAISAILSTPIQALGEDINEYLRSIRKLIEGEGSILKDRKREKALKWIDHLLSAGLSAIKDKRERLQSKIEEAGGTLSDMTILTDRAKVEESIVSANEQLTRLQAGIARAERPVVSLEEKLAEKEGFLLETLERIAGTEIEVQF